MKISIGCDHGALELKNVMVAHLTKKGYEVKDFGTYTADSCDYPEFAEAAARAVASGECDKGIVLCTTGIGVSITANKVKGIRCALLSDLMSAKMTRQHNDTNVMAMGAGAADRRHLAGDRILRRAPSSAQNRQADGCRRLKFHPRS